MKQSFTQWVERYVASYKMICFSWRELAESALAMEMIEDITVITLVRRYKGKQ